MSQTPALGTIARGEAALEHYGIKGMKWGVRKNGPTDVVVKATPGKRVRTKGGKFHEPSEDAIRAAVAKQKARKSKVDSLSNKELQDLVQRMNLEQQYNRLDPGPHFAGAKFARALLTPGVADATVSGLSSVDAQYPNQPSVSKGLKLASNFAAVSAVLGPLLGGKKKK